MIVKNLISFAFVLVSIVTCDKSVFVSHRCLDFQLQNLFSLAAQPHDCVNSSP